METIRADGSPVLIETVVYRYGSVLLDEHDSVEAAQAFIDYGEDYGELSSVGVYVDGVPHSAGPWEWHRPVRGDPRRGFERMVQEYALAKARVARWAAGG